VLVVLQAGCSCALTLVGPAMLKQGYPAGRVVAVCRTCFILPLCDLGESCSKPWCQAADSAGSGAHGVMCKTVCAGPLPVTLLYPAQLYLCLLYLS
jgi:hypothetical protein